MECKISYFSFSENDRKMLINLINNEQNIFGVSLPKKSGNTRL